MFYHRLNLRYVIQPFANLAAPSQLRLGRVAFVLLSLLLATPITGWCQQKASAGGEMLTLEQAIALALRENHTTKIAALEVGKVEDELAATRTIRLPSMHLYTLVSQQLV